MILPAAHIVHRSRGRLRLKLPNKCRDADWLQRTASRLEELPDVERVDVTAVSGSLLIYHQDGPEFRDQLASTGLFSIVDGPLSSPPVLDRITEGVCRSDRSLERRTGGRINLRTLLILVLIALAIAQSVRRRIMVPAITLLMFAAQLVFMSKKSPNQSPPS